MRVKITIGDLQERAIPIDYHYYLSSAIYAWMRSGNEEIAAKYHYSKDLKPFTFSEIFAHGINDNGSLKLTDEVGFLIFSSCFNEIVEAVVTGALGTGELRIKDASFPIVSIEVLKEPEFTGNMRFKTLSPIVVSKKIKKGEKDDHWELYPKDKEWYVLLERNLKKRLRLFTGEEYSGKINIRVLKFIKGKRYRILGGYVRASKIIFEISAPQNIIRIAYQSGFGERTGQGFGCVDVIKE